MRHLVYNVIVQLNSGNANEGSRKQLEQLIPQLQEQLQVNFLQQTHLLQSDRAKSSPALQHLQVIEISKQTSFKYAKPAKKVNNSDAAATTNFAAPVGTTTTDYGGKLQNIWDIFIN